MRIQIIDDERTIGKALGDFLQSLGHDCIVYSDSKTAVSEYTGDRFDAVITDLRMPGLDGLEVLDRIFASNPGALVIAMTGYADTQSVVACLDRGAYAYFRKPLDLKRLINTLKRAEKELSLPN